MSTDKQNINWSTGSDFFNQLFGHSLQIQSQTCAQIMAGQPTPPETRPYDQGILTIGFP